MKLITLLGGIAIGMIGISNSIHAQNPTSSKVETKIFLKNYCFPEDHILYKDLNCAAEGIRTSPYVFMNLDLNRKERAILNHLEVRAGPSYERFGDFFKLKEDSELPNFFRSVTNCTSEEIKILVSLVERITAEVVESLKKETGWLTIRPSKKHGLFNTPRWHRDGCFYCDENIGLGEVKFAMTLKGPQTLFYPLSEQEEASFTMFSEKASEELINSLEDPNFPQFYREKLSKYLDSRRTVQGILGQGSFFQVGGSNSAVHSEPKSTDDRLFFSIVPGSKKQVEHLKAKWGSNDND